MHQFRFNLIIDWAKHCFQEPSGNSQIRWDDSQTCIITLYCTDKQVMVVFEDYFCFQKSSIFTKLITFAFSLILTAIATVSVAATDLQVCLIVGFCLFLRHHRYYHCCCLFFIILSSSSSLSSFLFATPLIKRKNNNKQKGSEETS